MNRCYYAAFYATSAVLLFRGHRFTKHSGLRATLHRELVKPGHLSVEWGQFFDQLFEERQQGDYVELTAFEPEDVARTVSLTAELVKALRDTLR